MAAPGEPSAQVSSSTVPAAIQHLLVEHAAGRQQFAVLRDTVASMQAGERTLAETLAQLRAVLAYLTDALEVHIAKEEGPLFPRLRAALPDDDRLIDEMAAEHDLIRIKRDDLRTVINEVLDDDHQDLRADLQRLRATVAELQPVVAARSAWPHTHAAAVHTVTEKTTVHFDNEEELVFPLAPQLLDAATLDRTQAE